jgi:site-specific DNA-cytosine methylase
MEQKIIGYTRDREKGKVIGYHLKDTSNTLHTGGGTTAQYILENYDNDNMENKQNYRIRKLTERECFRLMDVEDADIDKIQASGVSKSQQYKMAGNSICVGVLYEIFRSAFVQPEKVSEPRQMELF